MPKVIIWFTLVILLTGCARRSAEGSETQAVVVETQLAPRPETEEPVVTPSPKAASPTPGSTRQVSPTPSPSRTALATRSSPSATATHSLEDLRAEFVDLIIEYLERGGGSNEVQSVRRVSFSQDGYFDIELESLWTSKDLQPSVAFEVIYWLGRAWADTPREFFTRLSGQDRFVVRLVTYSSDGKYAHQSETNLWTVQNVGETRITYEGWVAASKAGFR